MVTRKRAERGLRSANKYLFHHIARRRADPAQRNAPIYTHGGEDKRMLQDLLAVFLLSGLAPARAHFLALRALLVDHRRCTSCA